VQDILWETDDRADLLARHNDDPDAEGISKIDPAEISDDLLREGTKVVRTEYQKLGATDQIAKGPDLKKAVRLQAELAFLLS
jgi:hypothetical protein